MDLNTAMLSLALVAVSTIATVVLACITYRYMQLTRGILEETRLVRMDSLRPVVVPLDSGVEIVYVDSLPVRESALLRLKNIGAGAALQISAQVEWEEASGMETLLDSRHTHVASLAPGEVGFVRQHTTPNGFRIVDKQILTITFGDVFGRYFEDQYRRVVNRWQQIGFAQIKLRPTPESDDDPSPMAL